MIDHRTVTLAAALADPADRPSAADALAAHLGATALIILVVDTAVDAFVPAPGFRQTLPGGEAWREFLTQARVNGVHRGIVGYPAADQPADAVALTAPGVAIIFIGGSCEASSLEAIEAVLPLLSGILRSEQAAMAAAGELRVAQHDARRAEVLAQALDTARAEVEGALQKLERQARSLDEARARAEEATQAKDEFLAMLGHELRNPLSPIVTALQLMRLKGQQSREIDIIERQVTNVKSLVDDLLDVSRITRGKVSLRKERVELAEIAARAIEIASPVLERKRQMLALDLAPTGLLVDADPSRLSQVLANLLTNAAKYSDKESRIDFGAARQGERVCIWVRDQGVGLEPAMLDRVFDLFVQQRQLPDRSEGGLGLGLAIVRNLVLLHGGSVKAQSAGKGLGSEFIIDLPAAARGPATAETSSISDQLAAPNGGERVLIVDDNEDALFILSEALDSLGYTVRTAADGPEALQVAQAFRPQIALLDIGLPVMDGYELARRLRESSDGPGLRLIAVTGYGQKSDKERARAGGFDAHLVKPVGLEQLEAVLRPGSGP
ncbi:MAG: response regulator [Acidobacteriota bacterium]|nr:response regulator [Acidobacteriota bacterium]